jgi:hypothetical protein
MILRFSCQIQIPQETVGYVTGRDRSTLHMLEEETWTLMFFADKSLKDRTVEVETLLIVGPERGRKKALFKVSEFRSRDLCSFL